MCFAFALWVEVFGGLVVWLSPRGGLCSVAVVGSGILGVCPVALVFVLMMP